MSLPGSIGVPHQGQLVSWWGVPAAAPAAQVVAALDRLGRIASVQLGVLRWPTHRPMRKGRLPQRSGFSYGG